MAAVKPSTPTRLADGFGEEGLLPPDGGCTPKIGSPAAADAALGIFYYINNYNIQETDFFVNKCTQYKYDPGE